MATRLIRKVIRVDGVLVDPTSVLLSDPAGDYGVKRNDTDVVVVADGTAMTKVSTGVYEYSFESTDGVAYTAYVEIVYSGNTYHFEVDFEATETIEVGSLVTSYSDLRNRIARFAFGQRTTTGLESAEVADIAACIQDGLRDVYSAHKWSFLYPMPTITTTASQSLYDLPSGYDAMIGPLTFAYGASFYYPKIEVINEAEIRRKQATYSDAAAPQYAAIVTAEYDATTGSKRQLLLYPTPDAAYVLTAKMRLRPTAIDADNPYPLGAETLSPVIIEACLAAAERTLRDEVDGPHYLTYQRLLAAAIEIDKDAASPDFIEGGVDSDDVDTEYPRTGTITLFGESI